MLFKKVTRPQPTPPASTNRDRAMEGKDLTSASSIQLGYSSDTARSSNTSSVARGIKGGSLKDSRKRIAEAVGRK